MATKIRFTRHGAKKKPFYWLVVADARAPRDGQFIEKLGTYNPLLAKDNDNRVCFNKERINYWLSTGAQPTEKAEKLFTIEGISIDFKKKAFRKKYAPALETGKRLSKKALLKAEAESKKTDEQRAEEALAAKAAAEASEKIDEQKAEEALAAETLEEASTEAEAPVVIAPVESEDPEEN